MKTVIVEFGHRACQIIACMETEEKRHTCTQVLRSSLKKYTYMFDSVEGMEEGTAVSFLGTNDRSRSVFER